jgi:hypothetical protein
MAYRQYLINNADTIIKNNQTAAIGNCSNIVPIVANNPPTSPPILYTSIVSNPSEHDNNSDLKDTYLNNYIRISQMSSPGIYY